MHGITIVSVFAIMLVFISPASAMANCGVSHTECEYPCIEYYPNGTDCKKTRKVCHEVCDDFDVDRGGIDDANRVARPLSDDNKAADK